MGIPPKPVAVRVLHGPTLAARLPRLTEYVLRAGQVPLSRMPAWLNVLRDGLRHTPYAVEAVDEEDRTLGYLPLAYVNSFLFGAHLVSLPYLNSGGVLADDGATAARLIDRAVALADELEVRRLELRHESPVEHPALTTRPTGKFHMRLPLPDFPGPLWASFDPKVRNQVRKGEKGRLEVFWGGMDLLPEFYEIFSRNMRDLGTPPYGQSLFRTILSEFGTDAEICVVRAGTAPVAAALLLHGKGVTEVPSASSLREYNATCANMLMYWNLLDRAIQRGQAVFDFGRSTAESGPFRFKKQWGAEPTPAGWQHYLRGGKADELRPDNPRFERLIRVWRRLPLGVTRWIGPRIVRGIP
ncbi:MAG TPA: FemAB family XrtA/PEP-CTERM system-associated protein [Gemmataceae bacterium]